MVVTNSGYEQRDSIFIIEKYKGGNIIQTVAFDNKILICKVSAILHALITTLWTHFGIEMDEWNGFFMSSSVCTALGCYPV